MEKYAVHVGIIGCIETGLSMRAATDMASEACRMLRRGHAGRADWPVWIERLSDGTQAMKWDERRDEHAAQLLRQEAGR